MKLLETARKELPATFAISKVLDDGFSRGCSSLWGRIIQTIDLGEEYAQPAETQETEEPGNAIVDHSNTAPSVGEEEGQPAKTQEMEDLENAIIDHDKIRFGEGKWADINEKDEDGDTANSWGTWGQPQNGQGGGWGGDVVGGGWGSTSDEHSGDGQGSGWNVGPLPTLTTLLGPTNLPLTHTTGIFENSMRKIVDLVPPSSVTKDEGSTHDSPASGVEEGLDRKFGKIVLGPWIGWDCGKETIHDKPEILPRSRGPVRVEGEGNQGVERAHDPYKDNTTVFVDPSALDTLIIGIGISADWVQITRADEVGNPVGGGLDMWYMESVTQVIPSFYLA